MKARTYDPTPRPTEGATRSLFHWELDSDAQEALGTAYEWELIVDGQTGLLYEIVSHYCPCCGGPKGRPEPIYTLDGWDPPTWASPEWASLFQNALREALP